MTGLLVSTVIQLVLIICRARWQRTRISTRSEEHGNTVGANGSDINVEKLTQAFPTALRGHCIENLVQQGDTTMDSMTKYHFQIQDWYDQSNPTISESPELLEVLEPVVPISEASFPAWRSPYRCYYIIHSTLFHSSLLRY